jgi:hypothetical protein
MLELPAVPDYFGQFMAPLQRQQALDMDRQQLALQQEQQQEKINALRQAAAAQQQYQQDAAQVISNPSPEGFRALMLKYPEAHESLKDAWDQYGEGARQSDLSAASQVYAALSNGQPDLALDLLKSRKEALVSAGKPTETTDAAIDLIESGDPAKIKQAQGMAGFMLATSAGPDKIGPMLEALGNPGAGFTLSPGSRRFDAEGNLIAEAPYAPRYETIQTTDANGNPVTQIVRIGGDGAAPASSSGAGGFENAVSRVLKHEGGYNPKDMNGFPTNFGINAKANAGALAKLGTNIKNLTQDQAVQIYHDDYWVPSGAAALPSNLQAPYFDVYIRNPKFAKKALADSGGDPQKFMEISSAYFQRLAKNNPKAAKYAQAWADRDEDNAAIAGGGAGPAQAETVFSAPGGKGDRFTILSDAEAANMGLPSGIKYQRNLKTNQVTAVGGQNRQAKQIPQQVQTKVQPMVDVRDTLQRLTANWDDDYGGHTILGGGLNSLQSIADVGPKGMRDWWADFQSMDNVVRNQLFGSALTEHEKQAYASTTITPRMAPDQIRKNLDRRLGIIRAATARQQNFLKKNGYDADAVDALFQPLGDVSGSAPVKVNSVDEARRLPSGTLFVTPDGRTLRKK